MSIMIPEDKILEIKHSSDILEIISESIILKQAGKNHFGLCPFHSEKTPSFMVNPEKQIYKCFGCGESGDVFSFIMKKNGWRFPEALRFLSGRYGIDLPSQEMTPEQKKVYQEKDHLLSLNQMALAFYRGMLLNNTLGEAARRYLAKRGFSQESIDRFELGFAPDGWDHLVNHLARKKVSLAVAEKAGLIVSKDKNRFFDRFRERIIFPIYNMNRQLIGFGGRIIQDKKAQAKYMNSPETPLYHKANSLYGIDQARTKCRESGSVYVVEGYFDLIALFQHGVENVVATLGTALSRDHVKLLKGLASTIFLVYDSDQAGISAALRGLHLFLDEGVDARIIVLPPGHDPDTFIFQEGHDRFKTLAKQALSAILFLIDSAVRSHGLSIDGKLHIVNEMAPLLSEIQDFVARALYVKELSERTGIDERAINEKIVSIKKEPAQPVAAGAGSTSPPPPKEGPPIWQEIRQERWRMERQMISMLLQFPEMIREFRDHHLIDYFENGTLRHIGERILERDAQIGKESADLVTLVHDETLKRMIVELSLGEDVPWVKTSALQLVDQFITIKKRAKSTLSQRIKMAETQNDETLLEALLKEKNLHLMSMKKKTFIAGQR